MRKVRQPHLPRFSLYSCLASSSCLFSVVLPCSLLPASSPACPTCAFFASPFLLAFSPCLLSFSLSFSLAWLLISCFPVLSLVCLFCLSFACYVLLPCLLSYSCIGFCACLCLYLCYCLTLKLLNYARW